MRGTHFPFWEKDFEPWIIPADAGNTMAGATID